MKPVKLKPWDKLSREEQDLYLRILWHDDYSEKAIAEFLKATKGQVVRRRQLDLKIPTGERGKVKSSVIPERFFDLLDIHKMDEMVENGVTPTRPVEERGEAVVQDPPPKQKPVLRVVQNKKERVEAPPKEAPATGNVVERPAPEATCEWPTSTGSALKKQTLCGKPVVPGKRVCTDHARFIRSLTP